MTPPESVNHPFHKFEHDGWERAAAVYSETFEAATKPFAPALLEAVGIRKGMKLLEVACGTGYVASIAAERGADVTGIDFSEGMVAEARKRYPSLSFRSANAEDLPFSDAAFDGVAINFGVNHFPFPQRALSETHRVLRSGGRLAFTVWEYTKPYSIHRIVLDAVRDAGDPGASLPPSPSGSVADITTCERLLREAGFQDSEIRAEEIGTFVSLDSAQTLIDMFAEGTVRMSAVIKSQPREKAAKVLALVEKAVARYRLDGRLRISATALLATGAKS